MTYYVPQSIGVNTSVERQNFRRGSCAPYPNPILYTAPNMAMPDVLIKRESGGGTTVTIEAFDLNDVKLADVTATSVAVEALDEEGENEMLILGTGNWATDVSLQIGQLLYLRIDDESKTYYTDEFSLSAVDDGFPEKCRFVWAKFAWSLDGNGIFAGVTEADGASPVSAYPPNGADFFFFWECNASRPEWASEATEEPDAHGTPILLQRRLAKKWRVEGVPISESIADAMHAAALSDNITISFADSEVFSSVRDVEVTLSWIDGGCAVSAAFEFTVDYLVKQGQCP